MKPMKSVHNMQLMALTVIPLYITSFTITFHQQIW